MYQFFVDPSRIDVPGRRVEIVGEDVNHIRNVLRMKPGEEISVSNGTDGREYRCGILSLEKDRILCELRFVKEEGVELPVKVYLFQGIPKADKMELIVQKAVELGVYSIIPVACRRCVVKLDPKKAEQKAARWQEIARAAAGQSRRSLIPQVARVCGFSQALETAASMDLRLIPYEMAEGMDHTRELIDSLKPGQSVAVFIGPEGGFDEAEIREAQEKGMEPVTLGKRILRTETAGMTVLSWILYRMEDRGL